LRLLNRYVLYGRISLQKGSEYMYHLNKFCNIIFELRKERGWTQTFLADKLNIAPQSISKWECGIGYPDVTLFPIIAEVFDVPIGVLFGESFMEEKMVNTRKYVFEPLNRIELMIGNPCVIEVINGDAEQSSLDIEGDSMFVEYISVEKIDGKLCVNIKNPTGSDKLWMPYDRGNYNGENKIIIHSGVTAPQCFAISYLDLELYDCVTDNNTCKWICKKR